MTSVVRKIAAVGAFVSDRTHESLEGVKKGASVAGKLGRKGSKIGMSALRSGGRLAKQTHVVRRVTGPLGATFNLIEILGGEDAVRTVTKTAGAVVGAAAGAGACSVAAARVRVSPVRLCAVAVPASGVAGERVFGGLYDFVLEH
jgi:hypothetical protein